MKVLIVDDELLVRIGIKSCIDWQKNGMEVIGEASDGNEALAQIKLLQPDVILLDIKMPNLDGIELMRKLNDEKIKCKILILSGFDDLFHVKEAMKLGAVDYLHKPCMSSKDILDALNNIKQKIEEEISLEKKEDYLSQGSETNMKPGKEMLLRELVDGAVLFDSNLEQRLNKFNIKIKRSNICCIVFSVRNIKEVEKRYSDPKCGILQSSIYNLMNEVLLDKNYIDFFQYENNKFVILTSSDNVNSEKKMLENISSTIYLAFDAMKQFLDVDIVFGVSDIHTSCKEMKNAFIEALNAMRYRFYLDETKVIFYSEIKISNESSALLYIDSLIEKIKGLLTKLEYRESRSVYEELTNFLKKEPCLSEQEIKKLFNGFLFLIKEGKAGLTEMELINNCETITQLLTIWEGIINEKALDSANTDKYRTCSYLVKKIIKFIEDNYSQEITLSLLSKNFNVSPNYISKLFREETGENLFHYIGLP